MAIRPKSAAAATPAPAAAAPATRARIKPKAVAPAEEPAPEEAPAEQATPPARPRGIKTAAQREAEARAAAAVNKVADAPADGEAATADEDADDLSWAHQGEEAKALAAELAKQKEEEREEKRARGYWPIRFNLIPPSANNPDQYQKDVIILDERPGPCYFEHVLKNPRTGFWDVYEPCPHEYDSCPLCPPAGERKSQFVMLLTVLNINGYTYKRGAKQGQHVPIVKELMAVMVGDQPYFHSLLEEHGTLRGIQLTMTRTDKYDPHIGKPAFVGKFENDDIEGYIKQSGLWVPKTTREGEKIAEEDHLMHPFDYKSFLNKPSGADLRKRYANGGIAPVGSRDDNSGGQWGGSRYAPSQAGGPGATGGGFAGADGRTLDDLDDDVPF